jgi:hypothetical protein
MYKPRRRETGARRWGEEEGKMRVFILMRLVAAIVIASGLSVAAGSRSAAQDDEVSERTAAEEVRDLVHNQREQVLDDIAAIMAGNEEDTEPAEIAEIEEPEDGEGEDEGEDGEGEDEGEDGEAEDGEGEDEGVGGEGEDCELQGGAGAGDEVADAAATGDDAEAEEAEDSEAGGDAEAAQSAGGEAETAGDQGICALPSTGTGSIRDAHGMFSVFAALAAVTAAAFGLRQRFI